MNWLSGSLEIDSSTKDAISIQIPVVNFLDSDSLVAWFKVRNVCLRLGTNFENRINVYMHLFSLVTLALNVFFLLVLCNLIPQSFMSSELWLMLALITLVQNIWTLLAFYQIGMLNKTVYD